MAPVPLVTVPSSSTAVAIGCCQARDPGVAVTNRREQNKVAREHKVSRTEVFGVSGWGFHTKGGERCGARDIPSSTCTRASKQPFGGCPWLGYWPELEGR